MPIAQGRNGTIEISEQTTIQRQTIESRNTSNNTITTLGVARDNLSSLFSSSPSIITNRVLDPDNDGGMLFENDSNIYAAYARVIDPEEDNSVEGFGFYGTEKAYMNYSHPNNPFITTNDQNTQSFNPVALTDGSRVTNNNNNILHYKGYPDLQPNSLSNPGQESGNTTPVLIPKNNNLYGNTFSEYRDESETSDTSYDSLGSYFKNIITEGEQ